MDVGNTAISITVVQFNLDCKLNFRIYVAVKLISNTRYINWYPQDAVLYGADVNVTIQVQADQLAEAVESGFVRFADVSDKLLAPNRIQVDDFPVRAFAA